ncbi:MAG TPA: ThiF family adenylyltransferase, partial [Gammaproteobacteria bacterium]|nr:ThiF family adenylyltransferase [Gammaproteobacteria bacterium]
MPSSFRYERAFCRNLGWITEWEQQLLRDRRVAIAGLGGVGGRHLLTLARLGIGAFHLADPDHFELANFNRQAGATLTRLGGEKLTTMTAMARDINPELRIVGFPEGVADHNVDSFLDGVDLFVDGLDFFLLDIRARVFRRCAELG